MNWKEKMRKDGLENGFGMIAYETEPLIQFIEDLLKHSQQQLLESLEGGAKGMRFEDDLRTSERNEAIDDFLTLIQSKKELL